MSPAPSDNPPLPSSESTPPPASSPPLAAPASGKGGPRPSLVMAVVLWFFWALLFLSYPVDALVASLQKLPPKDLDPKFVSVLAFTGFMQLTLAVFLRWLFFRFLIHEKRVRPGSWPAAVVGMFGGLVIFSQIKAVEVYGFILWLGSQSWPHYLSFAVPSLLFFLLAMPAWLIRRRD